MADQHADHHATAPSVSIRERGKAERRRRVVETAAIILSDGGVEALSMRTLSVESGVSLPTIYNLVGGRDDVLAAVLDQLGTVFEAEAAASSADALARCFELTDRLLDTIITHAGLTRSIIAEGLTPLLADADSSLFRRYGIALLTALVEAFEHGDLDEEAEPLLVVDQLASLTAVRIFRWATDDEPGNNDGRELRAAVTHGIGMMLAGSISDQRRAEVVARVRDARIELLGEGTDT